MNLGIYRIRTQDGRYYFGQAIDIPRRFKDHRTALKANKHSNVYLQNIYNKYGLEHLIFEVLLLVDTPDELNAYEQCLLDSFYDNPKCLNLAKDVVAPARGRKLPPLRDSAKQAVAEANRNRIWSKESRQKLSGSLKDRQFSEDHRKKIGEASKQNKTIGFAIEAAKQANSKAAKAVSPEAQVFEASSAKELARVLGISNGSIPYLLKGTNPVPRGKWKGWTFEYT